jgi:tetratricopeptide (TPR) repeat protein
MIFGVLCTIALGRFYLEKYGLRSQMNTPVVVAIIVLLLPSSAATQDSDSVKVGIHQSEAELHRWDGMKIHPSVPQLQRGVEMARTGDLIGAVRAFQKAAPARPSMAYFNLGLISFETGKLEQALRYFRLSYRARKDSACRDYLQNTERLINERRQRR